MEDSDKVICADCKWYRFYRIGEIQILDQCHNPQVCEKSYVRGGTIAEACYKINGDGMCKAFTPQPPPPPPPCPGPRAWPFFWRRMRSLDCKCGAVCHCDVPEFPEAPPPSPRLFRPAEEYRCAMCGAAHGVACGCDEQYVAKV